jgi:hypothetical protein
MKFYTFKLVALCSMCLLSPSVFAQEDAEKLAQDNQGKVEKEIQKETPITQWIDAENKVLDSLSKDSQQVFYILRNKHSVMRSVEVVKRDVSNAVEACGENNKDMTDAMNARFKQWKESVNPILDDAKEFLELELTEQDAFEVKDFKRVTQMNDEAYDFSESQIKKQIVTTPEACQGLLDSMDRTEQKLIDILKEALLPEEVVRTRVKQMSKEKNKTEDKE